MKKIKMLQKSGLTFRDGCEKLKSKICAEKEIAFSNMSCKNI